ncbi:MAG: hypothetical protein U1E69_08460 [Tabrizicola sp.]|uniref:hypothetical protein n=1 Tax=Tabrizicola sp. TaxID=2005166 RepID=UPI002AB809E9|nr:hypothetical protein [Tabrizicola sp.]MDZ4086821.1 hypothetical protein [Tabrizicola sp.]
MLAAAVALAFDMTSVLALMYPGRERVEIVALDGTTYVYACKPGPAGEPPREQAEKAQAAFEENLDKFAEVFVGEMMQDVTEGAPTLSTALDMNRRTNSWAGSMTNHLEKEYGCALLG